MTTCRPLLLVAALLAAPPALAAPRSATPKAPAAAPAPAAPLAATAITAAPALAPSPGVAAPARDRAWRTSGLLGLARLEGESGVALRADAETRLVPLGAKGAVGAVVSLGVTRWSSEETVSPGFGISTETEASTLLFALVPSFRLSVELAPRLLLYGDTGLGLAYANASAETRFTAGGVTETTEVDGSGVGTVLRFAAGGAYDVDARLRLGAELGLGFHHGELRGSVLTFLVGATWRL